jgi:hypothetical protein
MLASIAGRALCRKAFAVQFRRYVYAAILVPGVSVFGNRARIWLG